MKKGDIVKYIGSGKHFRINLIGRKYVHLKSMGNDVKKEKIEIGLFKRKIASKKLRNISSS